VVFPFNIKLRNAKALEWKKGSCLPTAGKVKVDHGKRKWGSTLGWLDLGLTLVCTWQQGN